VVTLAVTSAALAVTRLPLSIAGVQHPGGDRGHSRAAALNAATPGDTVDIAPYTFWFPTPFSWARFSRNRGIRPGREEAGARRYRVLRMRDGLGLASADCMSADTAVLPPAKCDTDVDRRQKSITISTPMAGMLWFGGWLFTIAFAELGFWKAVLALIIWPYFLGVLAR
jgi:hypothetical protein